MRDQGARDRDALALAAGEFGGTVPHPVAQTDRLQRLGGLRMALFHRQPADAKRHCNVVERAEFWQQVMELIDEAQMLVAQPSLLRRIELRHLLPHQLHCP